MTDYENQPYAIPLYDLVEDYLDEFIDRIKSLRASARSEDLFAFTWKPKQIHVTTNQVHKTCREEINEILDDMQND